MFRGLQTPWQHAQASIPLVTRRMKLEEAPCGLAHITLFLYCVETIKALHSRSQDN